MRGLVAAALVFALPAVAGTQPAPPPPAAPSPPDARPDRSVSLTISPAHLLPIKVKLDGGGTMQILMLEVTGELRAHPRLGVAGIAGFGRAQIDDGSGSHDFVIIEAGAQANGYLVGSFDSRHGLHLGLEILYLTITGENTVQSVAGEGLSLAPYIGYKFMADGGFTFVAQLGGAYVAVRAESEGEMSEDTGITPLLNLNLGWSF